MRRLFLLVAAVMLVDTMFFAAVAPLLPRYSDDLDLTKSAAGILTAAYPAGTLAGSLPGGWLAARVGVKPTLMGGLALLGTTSLVFGLGDSAVVLVVARFFQGVGGAFMWTAGMAWLVGAAPPERKGQMIGAALGAAIVGVLLGPVLGGLATVAGPEAVFGGVSVLAAGLLVWAWGTPGVEAETSAGLRSLFAVMRQRPMLLAFWLFSIPALFAGVLEVLAPLRLDELGASGVVVGGIFLIASGVEAVLSPISGRLSDRHGRLAPIRVGLGAAAIAALVMPLPGSVPLVALALVGAIASVGIFWAPATALLSDASETAGLDQGLAFAVSNIAWSGGHLIGGGGGGALADHTADAVPYVLVALACALTLAALLRRRSSAREPSRSGGIA